MDDVRVITITFNGRRYRRYPNSKNATHRHYFGRSGAFLHRDIWIYHNGPIDEGIQVHHVNGDTTDNRLENLMLVTPKQHAEEHGKDPKHKTMLSDRGRRSIVKAASKIRAWQLSEEGHNHYVRLGKATWEKTPTHNLVCEHCSGAFSVKTAHNKTRFCSNNCKSAWRRASKRDHIDTICVVCKAVFSCNMYSKQQTCSRVCGQAKRRGNT